MRRLLPCLCLMVFCASGSFAQSREYPKFDFTAAYALNRIQTTTSHQSLNGFTGALGWNFRDFAALEGDMTYTTKTFGGVKRSMFTYLIGPRFTKRIRLGGSSSSATRHNHPEPDRTTTSNFKLEPFVHALFGGGHFSGIANTNGWAGKMGGGLDIVAGKHLAVRVVELDYYRFRGTGGFLRLNNALFTFGVRLF